ncbi:MAG: hypothetical protein LBD23_03660 [Oscillospiraceae bacterium]|jgi:hypothetical protein|nr:hypothetical protein [Oscillospiraceae bacterium]
MEKVIKIIMCEDKSIKIMVNDEEKHIIQAQDRSISAESIYKIIGFSAGDRYTVSSENETEVDTQVLEFFVGLFNDVAGKINTIDVSHTDAE